MKLATSELEHLREEVKNCHHIIKDLQKKREFVGLSEDELERLIHNFGNDPHTLLDEVDARLRSRNT